MNNIFAVTCESLNLANGGISYSELPVNGRYPVDTVASYSCHHGYSLTGLSSRICQTSGNWNNQNPSCNQGNHSKMYFYTNLLRLLIYFILLVILCQQLCITITYVNNDR